ncbi:MAG: rhodanese-like domain-containing protein, partial [Acidimicrobiales bacterium]|nr:rhodanese-like domain-containing protein [Acidimicrobiales bacterium]
RPDLLVSFGHSRDELASCLYDSLHERLMTLPDATRVFPGHGAGSACGKNLSTDTSSTIGEQRRNNYAVKVPDRDTFIDLITEGQPTAPAYFPYDAVLNQSEHGLLNEEQLPTGLSLDEVDAATAGGAVLVDVRDPEDFARGHLVGAINVGLNGRYAEFAGSVVPVDVDIVLFADPGTELEAKNRLARIGFDRVVGSLVDPYEAMTGNPDRTAAASRLTSGVFAERIADIDDLQVVDVRAVGECGTEGAIPGSVNLPVSMVRERMDELTPDRPTVVYCAGGYRSSVVASMLRSEGFGDVSDLIGGFGSWEDSVEKVA